MIARLRGIVVERGADHTIIECAGVGYLVNISSQTLLALPEPGESATLHIHTQFASHDGKITLYGFATVEERQLFDLLISVKGVSPSKSLPILSGAAPHALAQMISEGRAAELRSFRGVGKKTADALVFELADKTTELMMTWGAANRPRGVTPAVGVGGASPRRRNSPELDEVAGALLNLGWKPAEVDTALDHIDVPKGATLEVLLRQALQAMPR